MFIQTNSKGWKKHLTWWYQKCIFSNFLIKVMVKNDDKQRSTNQRRRTELQISDLTLEFPIINSALSVNRIKGGNFTTRQRARWVSQHNWICTCIFWGASTRPFVKLTCGACTLWNFHLWTEIAIHLNEFTSGWFVCCTTAHTFKMNCPFQQTNVIMGKLMVSCCWQIAQVFNTV